MISPQGVGGCKPPPGWFGIIYSEQPGAVRQSEQHQETPVVTFYCVFTTEIIFFNFTSYGKKKQEASDT